MKHSETRNFVKISPEILYFGTPVAVISSLNADGTTNLAAMSSFWALDDRFLLGLTSYGQTAANLERWSECVLNFPSPSEWEHVERLGHTTGRVHLLRYHHKAGIVHASNKFSVSGFTALKSELVRPDRAAECPVQIEARVLARHTAQGDSFVRCFELQRLRVHASPTILNAEGERIDVFAWSPLFYVFRHYFGKGDHLGKSFRAKD
jgi:flavin reductase (DIM6/NTAB) family NADH-FMN oxidoreductase RutF